MAQFPPLTYPNDFKPFDTNQSPDPPFEGRAAVVKRGEVNFIVFNVNLINPDTGERKRLSRYQGIPYLKDNHGVTIFDIDLPDITLHLFKGDRIYIGSKIEKPFYKNYYNVRTLKFIDEIQKVEIIGVIAPEDIDKFVPLNEFMGPSGPLDPDLSIKYNYNPKFNNARFNEQIKNEKRYKSVRNYFNKEKEKSANLRLPTRIKTRKTFGGRKRKSHQIKTNKKRRHHK